MQDERRENLGAGGYHCRHVCWYHWFRHWRPQREHSQTTVVSLTILPVLKIAFSASCVPPIQPFFGYWRRPRRRGTVGRKSHDPCFHKKYMEAGVMAFATHCTVLKVLPGPDRAARWKAPPNGEIHTQPPCCMTWNGQYLLDLPSALLLFRRRQRRLLFRWQW